MCVCGCVCVHDAIQCHRRSSLLSLKLHKTMLFSFNPIYCVLKVMLRQHRGRRMFRLLSRRCHRRLVRPKTHSVLMRSTLILTLIRWSFSVAVVCAHRGRFFDEMYFHDCWLWLCVCLVVCLLFVLLFVCLLFVCICFCCIYEFAICCVFHKCAHFTAVHQLKDDLIISIFYRNFDVLYMFSTDSR